MSYCTSRQVVYGVGVILSLHKLTESCNSHVQSKMLQIQCLISKDRCFIENWKMSHFSCIDI